MYVAATLSTKKTLKKSSSLADLLIVTMLLDSLPVCGRGFLMGVV
jgi:hypothetical protein